MTWITVLLGVIAAAVVAVLLLIALVRHLRKVEPYGSFLRLKTSQKIRFFRRLLADRRVPFRVKVLPVFLIVYLLLPFDIFPDFIPVVGMLDDVAAVLLTLWLVLRWTPRNVVDELLLAAKQEIIPPPGG